MKQLVLMVIGIIATLGASFLVGWSLLNPTPTKDLKLFKSTINPINSYISEPGLCQGMSEKQCFRKLTNCIEATSIDDYFAKKNDPSLINNRILPSESTSKLNPPLRSNFPNAEIFVQTIYLGGGDSNSFPFIRLDNLYCDLNNENLSKVFEKIATPEDALNYYIFATKTLGDTYNVSQIYVMSQDDFKIIEVRNNAAVCPPNTLEGIKNRTTTVKAVEDGYLMNLIGFNYIGTIKFFEREIFISYKGEITTNSEISLLECGPGAVF